MHNPWKKSASLPEAVQGVQKQWITSFRVDFVL